MLVIAETASFVKRFLLPPVCAERCWMYRLYSSLWQENVQLTICSSPSWSPLCFFLSVFSSNTQRCWLSDGDWLPEGVGWTLPPFYNLLTLNRTPWPAMTLWVEGSQPFLDMTWPPFCFREKLSSLLFWALPSMQSKVDFMAGWGGGEMLSTNSEVILPACVENSVCCTCIRHVHM